MKLQNLQNAFLTLLFWFAAANAVAETNQTADAETQTLESTYERLLPLEGGSNFRDLGGYKAKDNKTVKRGLLFRSGAMANLTDADMAYLKRFGFQSVVDLRSQDELELYPNHWAKKQNIDYFVHPYSMADMMAKMAKGGVTEYNPAHFYSNMPKELKPQMQMYFKQLVEGQAPLVVNCAAGQDRTGFASAVLLESLGVPREAVIKDYLLSTEYRRPVNEMAGVDLEKAAETNTFAKLMLRYKDQIKEGPKPLLTDDQTPYIVFALNSIDEQYGSVEGYLQQELGFSEQDIKKLRAQYLN